MNLIEHMKEISFARLGSAEDHDARLGYVMAFVCDYTQNEYSPQGAYYSFVHGAADQGYRVLLVNNLSFTRQPTGAPRATVLGDNVHNVFLSWLTRAISPTAEELTQFNLLLRQYDFILLGTGGSKIQGKNGLFDLDLAQPFRGFDGRTLVDRFVVACGEKVDQSIVDKTVTYATTNAPGVLPLLVTLAKNEFGFVTLDEKGQLRISEFSTTFRPKTLAPSAVSRERYALPDFETGKRSEWMNETYCKWVFAGMLNLLPAETLYVPASVLKHVNETKAKRSKYEKWVGWSVFSLPNVSVLVASLAGAIEFEWLLISGLAGVITGGFSVFGVDRVVDNRILNAKPVQDVIIDQGAKICSSDTAELRYAKSFKAISASPTQQEEYSPESVVSTAPALPATPATIGVRTSQKVYKQALSQYKALRERWLEYELDILKFLSAPRMRDLSCTETAQFFTCMHRCQTLLDAMLGDDENDFELASQFESAVAEMAVAFELAEALAMQTGIDYLSIEKQKNFTTASKMIAVANDESASPTERSAAFHQGQKMLSKTVITPASVYGELGSKIKMLESGISDDSESLAS